MAPPPAEHQGIPASQPLPIDSLPPSTGTIGTGGNTTLNETISIPPPEQASSPPATEHIQIPNQAPADPIAQTPAQEKPETQPVTFEWSPSPSGDAAGYILRISTVSDQTDYTFNTGQETRLVVDLPKGKSYLATVLAYNIAGESPPADPIRFDLF